MYFINILSAFLLFIIVPNSVYSEYSFTEKQHYSLSAKCKGSDREKVARCEDDARKDWDIREYDMFKGTRKFCCYAWDTLSCELSIIQKCDPEYASGLSYKNEQLFGSLCEWHGRRSVSCALRWWSLGLIIIAMLAIFAIAGFVAFRRRQGRVSYGYDPTATKRLP